MLCECLPVTEKATVITENLIESAAEIQKGRTLRGVQALDKKINRGDEPYIGLKATLANVNKIIKSVINAENRITIPNRNQQGKPVMDYYNPTTKQGVRVDQETGKFDTFINYNPTKK